MLELACDDTVFHFNKKHLEDPSIPMWVIKAKGESYYVDHVECQIPWSTKETIDNPHTKGSIKIKDCLLTIDDSNCASITKLTFLDKIRLRNQSKGITRVIVSYVNITKLKEALEKHNIKHGPIKTIGGACSTTFYVTDILKKEQMTLISLVMANTDFRILKPNEGYYKLYDDPKYKDFIDLEDFYDDDED